MFVKALSALAATALSAAMIGIGGSSASAASAGKIDWINPANSFELHIDGIPSCNCTDERGEYSVCYAEEVEVTVGSTHFSVSTGQSSTNCAKHQVAPGKCVYLRYNFLCHNGFWGINCSLVSVSTKTKEASPFDCA